MEAAGQPAPVAGDGRARSNEGLEIPTREEESLMASLKEMGLHAKLAWLRQDGMMQVKDTRGGLVQPLEKVVYEQALYADFRAVGVACLPAGIAQMHKQTVQGKFMLQVEEVVNIGEPHEHRYADTGNRTLKLRITDGVQTFSGIEIRRLGLKPDVEAGVKILVKDFEVRRGVANFGPEHLKVLGGLVMELEKARLDELDKEERARTRTQLIRDVREAGPDDEPPSQAQPPDNQPQAQHSNNQARNDGGAAARDAPMSQNAQHAVRNLQGPNLGQLRHGVSAANQGNAGGSGRGNSTGHHGVQAGVQVQQVDADRQVEQQHHQQQPIAGQESGAQGGNDYEDFLDDPMEQDPAYDMLDLIQEELAADPAPQPRAPQPVPAGIPQLPAQPVPAAVPPPSARVVQPNTELISRLVYIRDIRWGASTDERYSINALVTGATGRLKFDDGFSVLAQIEDGTKELDVLLGNEFIERKIGINHTEYATLVKAARKPYTQKLSTILMHLEAIMVLRVPAYSIGENVVVESLNEGISSEAAPLMRRVKSALRQVLQQGSSF